MGIYGHIGEARNRSIRSTTKIRLPEHRGDDVIGDLLLQ